MHEASCTCLQVAAAAERHAGLTDSLEERHQRMLTVDTMAPAVAMETDNACIDLTENDDMDVAPATGQFACSCAHCFFISPMHVAFIVTLAALIHGCERGEVTTASFTGKHNLL